MSKKTGVLAKFVKERRKSISLTQEELASRVGVGYNFIRELEQGKATLRLDKVNEVLNYFGYQAGPVKQESGEE